MSNDLINKEKETIGPLTETRWSQEYPYTYEGIVEGHVPSESPAGCVAVAGAQLMKYHNHPLKGDGVIPAYGTHPEKNIEGYEYQWELMPKSLTSDSSKEEIIATSTLILDVGLSARSGYGAGTAADPKDLAEGLIRNFGYDKNLQFVKIKTEGMGYTYSELSGLLKRDLNLGMPVIVGLPGHCVVCEGYNKNGDFYFNWGWGQPSRLRALKDVEALILLLGVRPAEEDVLIGGNLNLLTNDFKPGDETSVSFDIWNTGSNIYKGQIQVILADDFNVPRSYLSSPVDLHLDKGESKNIVVPVKFDDGFTFGPRTVQVLYIPDSLYPRALLNNTGGNLQCNVNALRPVSENLCIIGNVETVDSVAQGDLFTVSLEIKSEVNGKRDFAVLLVDSNLNEYYELGVISSTLKTDGVNPLSILCCTDDVVSEMNYYLLVVEKNHMNNGLPFSASIMNDDNKIPLSKIYVKNPTISYGDDVQLISNFDLSSEVYAEYFYETDVQYSISNAHSGIYNIQLSLTDENGDVLSFQQYYDEQPSADVKTIHFKLNTPRIKESKQFYLHADYIDVTKPNETYYLRPQNANIVNPTLINVTYRNFYDYIHLSSSLHIKSGEPVSGGFFQLESSIIFSLDHTTLTACLTNVRAIIEDENGKETEIGMLERIVCLINSDTPLLIDCNIPGDLVGGSYKLYLRATDFINANGEPLKKIPSFEEGIMDELNVVISNNQFY